MADQPLKLNSKKSSGNTCDKDKVRELCNYYCNKGTTSQVEYPNFVNATEQLCTNLCTKQGSDTCNRKCSYKPKEKMKNTCLSYCDQGYNSEASCKKFAMATGSLCFNLKSQNVQCTELCSDLISNEQIVNVCKSKPAKFGLFIPIQRP